VTESSPLLNATKPGEVVRATGLWLAEQLRSEGFAWLHPTSTLCRASGAWTEQISLQSSTRNRTGKQISVGLHVVVRDGELRSWRQAHPDLVLCDSDWLVGQPLGYVSGRANGYFYGSYEDGVVDLLDPAARLRTLSALVALVRSSVLPWFGETADPAQMLRAPAVTLQAGSSSIVEWLASRDRRDLIEPLVDRILSAQPGMRDDYQRGRELAHRGHRPSTTDRGEALGWSTVRLSLA